MSQVTFELTSPEFWVVPTGEYGYVYIDGKWVANFYDYDRGYTQLLPNDNMFWATYASKPIVSIRFEGVSNNCGDMGEIYRTYYLDCAIDATGYYWHYDFSTKENVSYTATDFIFTEHVLLSELSRVELVGYSFMYCITNCFSRIAITLDDIAPPDFWASRRNTTEVISG